MLQHGKGLVDSSELCVCQSAMTGKLTVSLIGENHRVVVLNDGFVIFQHVIAVMHSLPQATSVEFLDGLQQDSAIS